MYTLCLSIILYNSYSIRQDSGFIRSIYEEKMVSAEVHNETIEEMSFSLYKQNLLMLFIIISSQ